MLGLGKVNVVSWTISVIIFVPTCVRHFLLASRITVDIPANEITPSIPKLGIGPRRKANRNRIESED